MERVQVAVDTFLVEDSPVIAERIVHVMRKFRPDRSCVRVKARAVALDSRCPAREAFYGAG